MSEQYIVSARKYRPQTFDTVVGQQHITTTLKNAIRTGHLAHAFLFCGPRGVGKTTCARILARTINCENLTTDMEACGQCTTCRSFSENASFNVFELDAASNNSVDDIRSLTEQVRYAPQVGKYKVYIIDEVHMLSASAFNAFLKTLEEPPPYAIFILATTEKHKILPTILSRCQIFEFKRIQTEDIVEHLASICQKETIHADNTSLHVIAQKSEGCMRDALSMMDRIASFTNGSITYAQTIEHLNILDADVYFKLTDILLSKDVAGALLMVDDILQKGFEGDVILSGFAEHFRNILLCKDKSMAKLLDLPEEHKKIYYNKAQIVSSAYILSAINILNDAELNYRNALNKRMHVELALLKLCLLNDVLDTNDFVSDPKKKTNVDKQETVDDKSILQDAATNAAEANTMKIPDSTAESNINTPEDYINIKQRENSLANEPVIITTKPKIGKSLLDDVLKDNTTAVVEIKTELSQQLTESLFAEYIEQQKIAGELTVATNLALMEIAYVGSDTIHLVCASSINYHFAINQKDKIVAFLIDKTHNKNLRITAEVDANAEKEHEKKYKSKDDVFNEMASKNPLLLELKDRLQMHLK